MIISHKCHCVYMPPPKTGTESVEEALRKIGGEPFYLGEKHDCYMMNKSPLQDYYVFTTVRNPYTLLMSTFQYGNLHRNTSERNTQKNFEKFAHEYQGDQVERLFVTGHMKDKPKGCVPFGIHSFLKLESLEKDFNNLPFVKSPVKMPHTNKTGKSGLFYTPSMAEKIYRDFRSDFDIFKYNPNPPQNLVRIPLL